MSESEPTEDDASIGDVIKSIRADVIEEFDTMMIQTPTPSKHPKKLTNTDSKIMKSDSRYLSKERLGQGGMKQIEMVKDENMKRTVARATIHPAKITDESIELFIREARLTAALDHPNIVPVYDIGQSEEGVPFFIMKHLDGLTLQQILFSIDQKNPISLENFPTRRLIQIFKKVCEAISYAHKQKVLHLDIKPENIHIAADGHVYMIDWGLSKILNQPEETKNVELEDLQDVAIDGSMDGTIKGTPGYLATEQIIRKKRKIDERTDVYGLGGVLYSILSLEVPVSESSLEKSLRKTMKGDITPPSERRADLQVDKRLEKIAMKAMKRRPRDRYQSVDELIKDIDLYLSNKSKIVWVILFTAITLVSVLAVFSLAFYWFKKPGVEIVIESDPIIEVPKKVFKTTIASDNLVGWWTFDEVRDGMIFDESRFEFHGVAKNFENNDFIVKGKIGNAITFDGIDDYVDFGNRPEHDLSKSKQFTLALWVYKINYTGSVEGIVGRYSNFGKQSREFCLVSTGHPSKFALIVSEEGIIGRKNELVLRLGRYDRYKMKQWYHIVGVADGKLLKLYVNGVMKMSMEYNKINHTNFSTLRIGAINEKLTWAGKVDDFRFYNRGLNDEEIMRIYQEGDKDLE